MRPRVVYDGDCTFCTYWKDRWETKLGDAVEWTPFQELGDEFSGVTPEAFARSVHFFEADKVSRGAEAIFRITDKARFGGLALRAYQSLPPFAWLSDRAYRIVADHRNFFAFWNRLLWGLKFERPSFTGGRWLFLRSLGLIFITAFLSLYVQVAGLAGENGILPFNSLLERAEAQLGAEAYWRVPTLFWLGSSDAVLEGACFVGAFLSIFIVTGTAAPIVTAAAWLLYLSLLHACQVFLGFQWDILLLETAFVAIFFAPMALLARVQKEAVPSTILRLVLWWLLFRLMFSSGMVKIGDETWDNRTALLYHYETQPLPTVLGWFAHQLPEWFHRLSVESMFFIELIIPFFIIAPRRIRHTAGIVLIGFQVLITLTGNYAFFNWLTITLCFLLFDDQALRSLIPTRWGKEAGSGDKPSSLPKPLTAFHGAIAVFLVVVSSVFMISLFRPSAVPGPLVDVYRFTSSLHLVNGYGLFARMTTTRPEIFVEGSNDGETWLAYDFKWKPGALDERPRWVQPHQPRLDWQMWFAALSTPNRTPWFNNFLVRLLQGEEDVLALLASNPFPDEPPKYVRAVGYHYRFTDWETWRETGNWWQRQRRGIYAPAMALRTPQ